MKNYYVYLIYNRKVKLIIFVIWFYLFFLFCLVSLISQAENFFFSKYNKCIQHKQKNEKKICHRNYVILFLYKRIALGIFLFHICINCTLYTCTLCAFMYLSLSLQISVSNKPIYKFTSGFPALFFFLSIF